MSEKLVFVYGTLQSGGKLCGNMHNIGATFVGPGHILNRNWVMRDLSSYPALQKVEKGSGDYIHGEIWLTNSEGLKQLDKVEHYPDFYSRDLETVWSGQQSFKCVVYHIDPAGHNEWMWQCPVVKSGTWSYDGPDRSIPFDSEDTMHQNYDASDDSAMDELEPIVETTDETVDFVVEKGVYITNDWGDMYGPYDDIQAAVVAVTSLSEELEHVNVLTIGFRIVRENLHKDELADIDCRTQLIA